MPIMLAKIRDLRIITDKQTAGRTDLPRKNARAYRTVQDWMVATGTNQQQLAKAIGISEPHLSNILSKSRRCSLYVALKLSKKTNVPIETIAEWPPEYEKTA